MHPALSIIVFTTASGMGYGLAAILGLGLLDPAPVATRLAHVLALALIAGGLLSSTLHLKNPQRAWRALSQWRSSWLSREGVMAILTFIPLAVSAWVSVFEGRYLLLPGLLGAAGAVLTVFCTAMIYTSLKTIDAWHTRLTPACYLLFSATGGLLLASLFAAAGGGGNVAMLIVVVAFLVAAWAVKIRWRRRAVAVSPLSSPESATGLGGIGRVRLFEPPHMTENYLTREMGFRVARKHAEKLFGLAVLFGGAVPTFLAALLVVTDAVSGIAACVVLLVAVMSHALGILVERWLFFAEARHAMMSYYTR